MPQPSKRFGPADPAPAPPPPPVRPTRNQCQSIAPASGARCELPQWHPGGHAARSGELTSKWATGRRSVPVPSLREHIELAHRHIQDAQTIAYDPDGPASLLTRLRLNRVQGVLIRMLVR